MYIEVVDLSWTYLKQNIKGALNPNFLNLTIEKNFFSKNVLVPFLFVKKL